MTPSWASELIVVATWSAACWLGGVLWAAYRAVGWVDRIRRWALTEPCPTDTGAGLGRGPEGVPETVPAVRPASVHAFGQSPTTTTPGGSL